MRIPQRCPQLDPEELFDLQGGVRGRILDEVTPLPRGKYLHWDELRKMPPPEGLTSEQWWMAVAFARGQVRKLLPVPRQAKGEWFACSQVDPLFEMTSEIDRRASGEIAMAEPVMNPKTRDRYIVRSLIEEATTSSQLEGAATTTRAAKEMLRAGRKPASRDERMVFNNFTAMEMIKDMRNEELTAESVLALQQVLMEGTTDDPTAAGRFRREHEHVVVRDERERVLHVPPPAQELPERMSRMLEFANGGDAGSFIHRVVRAIVLHFWLGYDHPFVDGNGRTARALFYWSMLSQGYWLAEFVSISSILKKAPARYAMSYMHSETSGGDATYFILYQLQVFLRSIEALDAHLRRQVREQRATEKLVGTLRVLNHRQVALVMHALKDPGFAYSIEWQRRIHQVVYQTARRDLLEMEEIGLLDKSRRGKAFYFSPVADFEDRLQDLGRGEAHRGQDT